MPVAAKACSGQLLQGTRRRRRSSINRTCNESSGGMAIVRSYAVQMQARHLISKCGAELPTRGRTWRMKSHSIQQHAYSSLIECCSRWLGVLVDIGGLARGLRGLHISRLAACNHKWCLAARHCWCSWRCAWQPCMWYSVPYQHLAVPAKLWQQSCSAS